MALTCTRYIQHFNGLKLVLKRLITLLLLAIAPLSQADDRSPTAIKLKKVDSNIDIKIDGHLNEAIWQTIPASGTMVKIDPDTLSPVDLETKTYFFYSDKGLYVGVWNEQPPETLLARLSSRDEFINRDGVSLTLDPSGRGLYGYWFAVNLGGTLQDGTVLPERQFTSQWDGPWYGAAQALDNGWSAEMFIPWSTITMPESTSDTREIGYYLSRYVAHRNERWAFPALPGTRSTFLSALQNLEVKNVKPKQQFTFYPYGSTTYDRNRDHRDAFKTGFDIFWRPSSNLQITATANPDFGNVESDKVEVNLTAFESYFPEKRAFFLEGQEIFATTPRARYGESGGTPTTLVYTRRIGSPPRPTNIPGLVLEPVEENQPSELVGAVKVTGEQGKLRYGILTAIEEDTKLKGLLAGNPFKTEQDGRDFGIARFLYEDTSTGARRSLGWISTLVSHPDDDAIVHGIDGHYLTQDGKWKTDAQLMFSDVADESGHGAFVDIGYTPQRGRKHELALEYYDEDLEINDLGFFRRNDVIATRYSYHRTESDIPDLKELKSSVRIVHEVNNKHQLTRSGIFTDRKHVFLNNNSLSYELNYFPKRYEDINSEGNGAYRVKARWNTGLFYSSNRSNPFSYGIGSYYVGEHIGGQTMKYKLESTWRPNDRFSLIANLTYEDKDEWLVHISGPRFNTYHAELWRPKLELNWFLSARQQFRVTAQWIGIKADEHDRYSVPVGDGSLLDVARLPTDASQDFTISRLTFQARYRWEIAPLSDLFVVYTRGSDVDNMPAEDFGNLLSSAWTDALIDVFVVKLRYRLGN